MAACRGHTWQSLRNPRENKKVLQTLFSSITKATSHLGLYSRHTNLMFPDHSVGSGKRSHFYLGWLLLLMLLLPPPGSFLPGAQSTSLIPFPVPNVGGDSGLSGHQNMSFFWPQWLVQSWVCGPVRSNDIQEDFCWDSRGKGTCFFLLGFP